MIKTMLKHQVQLTLIVNVVFPSSIHILLLWITFCDTFENLENEQVQYQQQENPRIWRVHSRRKKSWARGELIRGG